MAGGARPVGEGEVLQAKRRLGTALIRSSCALLSSKPLFVCKCAWRRRVLGVYSLENVAAKRVHARDCVALSHSPPPAMVKATRGTSTQGLWSAFTYTDRIRAPVQAFLSRGRLQGARELGRQSWRQKGLTATFVGSDAAVKQILLQLDENAGRRRFIIADLDETHVLISPDAVERVRVVRRSPLYNSCCRR